jgi:hypothetical protein
MVKALTAGSAAQRTEAGEAGTDENGSVKKI